MKFIAITFIATALSSGAFADELPKVVNKAARQPASEHVVTGATAQKMFQELEKAQPQGWEGDCGMGKCWVGGEVRCESKIGTSARNTPTTCTIRPLSE